MIKPAAVPDVERNKGPMRYLTHGQLTVYHACVVDVRHLRTVHWVDHYPCLPNPQKISGTAECGAIHCGYCVPIRMLNAGDENKLGPHAVTRLIESPLLENNLKSLVSSFVAQDKATRLPSTMTRKNGVQQLGNGATTRTGSKAKYSSGSNSTEDKDTTGTFEIQYEKLGQLLFDLKSAVKSGIDTSPPFVSGANETIVGAQKQTCKKYVKPRRANEMGRMDDTLEGPAGSATKVEQVIAAIGGPKVTRKDGKTLKSEELGKHSERVHGQDPATSRNGNQNLIVIGKMATADMRSKQMPAKPSKPIEQSLLDALEAKTVQAVVDTLSRNDGFIQSPIDYAKKRFQTSQSGNAATSRTCSPPNGIPHMVSETKNLFENGHFQSHDGGPKWKKEWLPIQQQQQQLQEQQQQPATSLLYNLQMQKPQEILSGSSSPLPHPKLTSKQKQHIREGAVTPPRLATRNPSSDTVPADGAIGSTPTGSLPIRPFLSKGSVAERVLIFERRPGSDKGINRIHQTYYPTKPLFNTWKMPTCDVTKPQQTTDGHPVQSGLETANNSVLSRKNHLKSNDEGELYCAKGDGRTDLIFSGQHHKIPRFYYPHGRPFPSNESEAQLDAISTAFSNLVGRKANQEDFALITKACQIPLYWKVPLFMASGGDSNDHVSCDQFVEFWKRVLSTCHDKSSKFIHILTKGHRSHLLPEDFVLLIQDVIDTHPGLTFLKEATEFHSRYVHTVIARIYYCTNRSWSGEISISELRKSNFLKVLSMLEDEDDINQVTEYFSYEHFYVIYCKFWELDKDHDLFIDKMDLARHNENAISSRMIERIFSGAVTRGKYQEEGKMGYTEFVWFLLSEEDKRHPTSIEYWFRCMDLDGDGFLSMYELEYFYEEQLHRMEMLEMETLSFQDCLCQMLDMIQPVIPGKISLADLKRCKVTPIFFDTFFNLEKYLDHEQRDPFACHRDVQGSSTSDWDRYAAEEYELLVAEEGVSDQQDDLLFDDSCEQEDEFRTNLELLGFDENRSGLMVGGAIGENEKG